MTPMRLKKSGTLVKFKPSRIADSYVTNKGVKVNYIGILQCITFMEVYKNMSLEELRLEDYQLEGLKKKTLWGVGRNGTLVKFVPSRIAESCVNRIGFTVNYFGILQCITCMEVYKNMSLEELHLEYYNCEKFSFQWPQPPISYASSSNNFGVQSKSSQLGQDLYASGLKASSSRRGSASNTPVLRSKRLLSSNSIFSRDVKSVDRRATNEDTSGLWKAQNATRECGFVYPIPSFLQKHDSISDTAQIKKKDSKYIRRMKAALKKRLSSSRNLYFDNETVRVVTKSVKSPAVVGRKNVKLAAPDREKDAKNFITSYDEQYAKSYLVFYEGTYCHVSNAKRRFIFLVYLLNNGTQDINQWCRNILGNPEVTRHINSRAVFWACDVHSGNDFELARVLKASKCYFRNIFVVHDFAKPLGYQMIDLSIISEFTLLPTKLPENILERYVTIWTEALKIRTVLLAIYNCERGTERSVEQSLRDRLDESFAKVFSELQERHRKLEIEYKIRQEEEVGIQEELDEQETDIESIQLEEELNAKKVALELKSSAVDHKFAIESEKMESTRHKQDQAYEESFLAHVGRNVLETFEKNLKYFIVREVFFNYFF